MCHFLHVALVLYREHGCGAVSSGEFHCEGSLHARQVLYVPTPACWVNQHLLPGVPQMSTVTVPARAQTQNQIREFIDNIPRSIPLCR